MQRIILDDSREVHFKTAMEEDIPHIIKLYQVVYHGTYTLKEAVDPEVMLRKIHDPNYFWMIAHLDEVGIVSSQKLAGNAEGAKRPTAGDEGCEVRAQNLAPLLHPEGGRVPPFIEKLQRIIGSVIFAIDHVNKIGKAYAAAVLSEFRGKDVMRTMVKLGLDRLTQRTRTCDVIYATTRTVSIAPQIVLEHLGFLPMGIFPNVRKVKSFETHGLEVFFRQESLKLRRQIPSLVPELVDFYKVVQGVLGLKDPTVVELEKSDPRKMGEKIAFSVNRDEKEVLEIFDRYQDKDLMDKVFFPFLEPNLMFVSEDKAAEFFVNLNRMDGNGVVIAYRFGDTDFRRQLMWFSEAASGEGMRYIEILVSAFRPEMQRLVIDARFLPNAYFPSMRLINPSSREDYIAFSRSFESLDFMDMQLVDTNRKFLDAFMKCWYEMLVRCQPDFGEEWRIG